MRSRIPRTVYYLGLVVVTTALFTFVYNTGMAVWEDRPQSVYRSLEVVVQSFTTTGYGEDAPWQTPQMHLLAITMQLTGIGLILTAVDVFAVPWLRDVLTPTVPRTVPEMGDHVVVCRHTPRTDVLVEELDARDHEHVLIEPDAETARDLQEADYRVVHGDPESTSTLENAHVGRALAVVADAGDATNPSIALSARECNPELRVITLVEDATLDRYHRAAGVDEVLSPRQLLGESLAGEVPPVVTADGDEGVSLGETFELVEFVLPGEDAFEGTPITGATLQEQFGVDVIGAWFDGEFESPIDPTESLDAATRLVVAGDSRHVDELRDATWSTVRDLSPYQVVIAGYGDSGQAASEALSRGRSEVTVLDRVDDPAVDVVGDARDPATLERAGVETAGTLVLTIGDDTSAVFTTLIARELNPDLRIVVRANEKENVQKLYRAGADYVQSLATVSGRMLVSAVFENEVELAPDRRIRVVRLPASGLAGRTLVEEEVRSVTGCTVVAVRRGDEVITQFDPASFVLEADDEVIVVGPDDAIARFDTAFGGR